MTENGSVRTGPGSARASTARNTPPIVKVMKWTCGGAATSAPRTGGGSTCSIASPSRRLPKAVRPNVCTLWTKSRRGGRRSRTQRWRTSRRNARTGTSGGRPSTRRCGRPTRTGRPCSRRSCSLRDGVLLFCNELIFYESLRLIFTVLGLAGVERRRESTGPIDGSRPRRSVRLGVRRGWSRRDTYGVWNR